MQMQKTLRFLAILLAAQLLLALGLNLGGPRLAAHPGDAPLLDLAGRAVDRITLEGGEGKSLSLSKTSDGWVLPAQDDFPADADKVTRLLERLQGLRHGLPVATSSSALKRFKVAEDDFERRIRLAAGDDIVATLYVGTSPGVRRGHLRRDGDDAVYALEFASYDVPLKREDWEDKAILALPREEIATIQVADLTLRPQGDTGWAAQGLADNEALDIEAAGELADKLAELRIGAVLGREKQADYALDKPVLQLTVTRKGGESIDYQLGKRDHDYVLKASSREEYFRLPGYTGDALVEAAGRDRLVAVKADGDAENPPEAASAN
ncbi:MAG TPA: DUF4340 domain-containing protein [Gammaproteobacteria bacterium]|nr:DUF4340 domain-containing protein [Gammaproteobacteria bacterium]